MDVVVGILVAVLVVVGVLVGLVVLALKLSSRALARRNRINPTQPTQAPNLWVWSQGHGAHSHRRLQKVAAAARAAREVAGVSGTEMVDLAVDLERQACALDDQVVLASRFSTNQRARRLYQLDKSIKDLEGLALRVTILASEFSPQSRTSARPLAERVNLLEDAVGEVRRLEAEARAEVEALGPPPALPPPSVTWRPPKGETSAPPAPVRKTPPPGSSWDR